MRKSWCYLNSYISSTKKTVRVCNKNRLINQQQCVVVKKNHNAGFYNQLQTGDAPSTKEINMYKLFLTGCLAVAVTLGVASFSIADEMPAADGAALWTYITKTSPYTKWSFWPDHQGMQEGRAPHAPLHKVFVNKQALESTTPPLKYGAIEVKENYSPAHELKVITVMYKVKDYNPKDGDWFWVKYSPKGEPLKAGKPKGCIGCHGTRSANDFVLVHEFK
ncbi:MAG: hypothetical protein DSY70_04495 [Desulfobulbus sp.]|nr:MAG: hypothetical protein DSY70_04495 [Desulfobulbus sp.]